jgi:hypothetical protein
MPSPPKTPLALAAIAATALLVPGALGCKSRKAEPTEPARPEVAAAAVKPAPVVYDPTKLLENGVAATEVWTEEPRNDAWADAVEATVGQAMGKDLHAMVPAAAVVLKCKTLSCLVGIDAPAESRESALSVTKMIMLGPWMVDLEPEEDGTQRWLFFTEPRFGDPQAFIEWYQGLRKKVLADIRTGKARNPLPVPAADVPAE